MNFLFFAAIVLTFVALVCDVIAVATSSWMGNYGKTSIGLFQTCLKNECFSNTVVDNDLALGIKAAAGLMLIPIPIFIISIILMVCGSFKYDRSLATVACAFVLLCGFLILGAVSTFTAVTNSSTAIIMTVMDKLGGAQHGYGFVLAWVCCVITLVAAIFGFISLFVLESPTTFESLDVQLSVRDKNRFSSVESCQRPLLKDDSTED